MIVIVNGCGMTQKTQHPRRSPRVVANARNGNGSRTYQGRGHSKTPKQPLPKPVQWSDIIPAGQWASYRCAIQAAHKAGIQFLLGGGFGLAVYTGRWRNTKDIDFYIFPRDREGMIAALSNAGFVDYFDQRPYDPGWIYRSTRDNIIVDIIWSMANRRAEVDELWFKRAQTVAIRDATVQIMPAEELLWCKLYILQRDHCDWTDIFNLLHAVGAELDWSHLLKRVGADVPLLQAALTIFNWLCPKRVAALPPWLRKQLDLPMPKKETHECEPDRIKLLDSRNWFAAFQPKDKYLEV